MDRRAFIRSLASGILVGPLAAAAQQARKPVIGFLSGGAPGGYTAAFRQGLNEAGYVEGRNVGGIEYRWADGQFGRLPALAADLVSRQVALIATATLPGTLAAKAATTTIPIVFVVGEDPIKVGLVASLNRPGGNVTGVSGFMNLLAAKRLELVRELAPPEAVLGFLLNPNSPNAEPDTRQVQTAADALGHKLVIVHAGTERELDAAFTMLTRENVAALCVNVDPFFGSRREEIIALAARHRLPAIYAVREWATAGGLMSYGASYTEAWRQAGIYAGRILKGEKPADLPVTQAAKFELIINLKTAKALRLTIPQSLLLRADEVIQ